MIISKIHFCLPGEAILVIFSIYSFLYKRILYIKGFESTLEYFHSGVQSMLPEDYSNLGSIVDSTDHCTMASLFDTLLQTAQSNSIQSVQYFQVHYDWFDCLG